MHSAEFQNHVCHLHKALYCLKQAPHTWYLEFRAFLVSLGFVASRADTSLVVYFQDDTLIYFLVYVDNLIITGSNASSVDVIVYKLHAKFVIKDLEALFLFCGLRFAQPQIVFSCLSKSLHFFDATKFRQVVGSLQHLCMTLSYISFMVNKLSQFMHTPSETYWGAVKHLLRYLNGTRDLGIHLLADTHLTLIGFFDADWVGDSDDQCSTGAFIIFLGTNPVSWKSTKQRTVAHSSTEAEYRAIASTECKFLPWYNISHLAIDYHFVYDLVQASELRVTHISVED
ncbi:hypothetical protein ZIOFF_072491 [Zingiber officinale]|uniref:Reverse transcriptase Ty1/copia-type domain-containing protein n=1 Tax=Zingiber officinale TaxID=94328 RepID=A0A8J5ENP8_ZINOF|nr:hypothetical protein ZIOFF_072491 [Zingiber officinale]